MNMNINVNTKSIVQIDIDSAEAFRLLCKTLDMEFVLDEDTDYFVVKKEFGEEFVYLTRNGCDELIDERGQLFIALRNVAVSMFPNVLFRNADYIYRPYQSSQPNKL